MANQQVLDRIAAWQAAGLIDPQTAERLRTAEAALKATDASITADAAVAPTSGGAGLGSFFGPTPSIAELFGYLGAGFMLVAWHVLTISGVSGPSVVEWLIPALAFGAAGVGLARRSDRERRAAGVAFAVATTHSFGAAWLLLNTDPSRPDAALTLSAASAVVVALGFRRALPAVLTKLGLLGALAALAASSLGWLAGLLFPSVAGPDYSWPPAPDPNALPKIVLQTAWWLAWALAFGVIGLWEARQAGAARASGDVQVESHRADRRAAVTRLAAGLTAVGGVASAITASQYDAAIGDFQRVLVPWLGDGLVLAVAVVLLALAIRRGATAYLYPAAIGAIVALSDLNGQYVVEQTGIGMALLAEGLLLIGVGILADRLRRRLAVERATWVPPAPSLL